jgi:UV DNA damage endonuclease
MGDYRLGFAVKVLGAPLRSHDSRRWQNSPHLSVSLAYLRDLFQYLDRCQIRFYRLAGQLAPYLTHPALPQFHRQIEECAAELAAMGDLARHYRLRLTLHPAHYLQLSSPHPAQAARAGQELDAASALLDALGLGAESVVVIHAGGAYGDTAAGRERCVRLLETLAPATRRRLALENGDRRYSLADALWIHRRTGIRLVFDVLHHRCLNPDGVPLLHALEQALATWPAGEQPKIHFSSPRTELRYLYRQGRLHIQMPLPNQHSDFIHPFEFIDFLRSAQAAHLRPFDIMLEAKAKELAVLRLREQVMYYAPDLAKLLS